MPDRSIGFVQGRMIGSDFDYVNLEDLKNQLFLNPDLKASEILEILDQKRVFTRDES